MCSQVLHELPSPCPCDIFSFSRTPRAICDDGKILTKHARAYSAYISDQPVVRLTYHQSIFRLTSASANCLIKTRLQSLPVGVMCFLICVTGQQTPSTTHSRELGVSRVINTIPSACDGSHFNSPHI